MAHPRGAAPPVPEAAARPAGPARLGRRSVLRTTALAATAAAGAGGWLLAACGPATAPPAAVTPAVNAGGIEVTFAPNWQAPWNKTSQSLCQQFIDSQFAPRHTGIRVRVQPSVQGQSTAQIAATIAGSGFVDVFSDCCVDLPNWASSGLLLPLDGRLRQDNVNPDQWSPLRIQALTFFGHLLALPAYDGPEVMLYRQDMLDAFGLTYPDPAWDYIAAEKLWRACARTVKGKPVYGVSLDTFWVNSPYLFYGWGGSLFDPGRTRCLLDSSPSVTAAEWFFGLIRDKIASPSRDQVGGLTSGREVFSVTGGWSIFAEATQLGSHYKWNIVPQPRWALRSSTMVNSDFYAINARTQHPDAAWTFFHWAFAEPTWTRFMMRTTLIEPALVSLWHEWESVVKAAAPPLANIHLGYYREAATSGAEVPQSFFLYDGAKAAAIMQTYWTQIIAGQISVKLASQEVTKQINALEQAAASQTAGGAKAAKAFPSKGPAIASVQPGL